MRLYPQPSSSHYTYYPSLCCVPLLLVQQRSGSTTRQEKRQCGWSAGRRRGRWGWWIVVVFHAVVFLRQQHFGECSTVPTTSDKDRHNNAADPVTTLEQNEDSCAVPTMMKHPKELQCGLYLAESTIPGAGLGIFTAVEKQPGETVGYGDVCIPMVDMYWHNHAETLFNPFKDYFWQGDNMGMTYESGRGDIEALCPGLDCAINCHLALINVQKSIPLYDDLLLQRERDAGAGAFTPFHNGTTFVSRRIPAGGELFKHYGDHWFTYRDAIFGKLPLTNDYPAAERVLQTWWQLKMVQKWIDEQQQQQQQQPTNASTNSSSDLVTDLYKIIVETINRGDWESRTLNALPKSVDNALIAAQAEDGLVAVIQPHHTRDLSWLQQHGTCIDHIQPGWSTLPQAGHGAFAARFLPQGSVITRSPLHHLPDYQQMMRMYNLTEAEEPVEDEVDGETTTTTSTVYYRMKDEPVHWQLFYNYCFGGSDSTVLLCPYGAGVSYINHNQTLANVRVVWPDAGSFLVHNHSLVEHGTMADLSRSPRPQLGLQYETLRDIEPGEELFLDYGDDWELAWQSHVAKYPRTSLDEQRPRYASAHYMNTQFGATAIRTVLEQEYDPYPRNLQLRCHYGILSERADPEADYRWTAVDVGCACRVEDRYIGEGSDIGREQFLYTVTVEWEKSGDEDDDGLVTWVVRTDVPRSALRFFDLPYTTNLHQPEAFRHAIGFPEDIFPKQWRNLIDEEDDNEENEDYEEDEDEEEGEEEQ